MHIVVIKDWQEMTPEKALSLAGILKVTAFEIRQRLAGKGPVVVATSADPTAATNLLSELNQAGFAGFIVDTEATGEKTRFQARRFSLHAEEFRAENISGEERALLYRDVKLLLPALSIAGQTEVQTETTRKFSVGKTLLAGGLPMSKKTTRQKTVSTESRERVLFLFSGLRSYLICPQDGMLYDGLGPDMQPSRELNFNLLIRELRSYCQSAVFDERLLQRAAQAKLLGPSLSPETNLQLAVEILARSYLD